MSIFNSAYAYLFSFVASGKIPQPTKTDLNGYSHIKSACTYLLTVSKDIDDGIIENIKGALDHINTAESLALAERCKSSRFTTTDGLYVPARSGCGHELRKYTLLDLHDYCSQVITIADTPESIRAACHGFLNHFPLVVLHPDFIRPQSTQARCSNFATLHPA